MDGSASPRKPSVRISVRLSSIFEVQWRFTASSRSAGLMPAPLSNAAAGSCRRRRWRSRCGSRRRRWRFRSAPWRRWPALDHLAGGNLVDDGFGKLSDGHAGASSANPRRWKCGRRLGCGCAEDFAPQPGDFNLALIEAWQLSMRRGRHRAGNRAWRRQRPSAASRAIDNRRPTRRVCASLETERIAPARRRVAWRVE